MSKTITKADWLMAQQCGGMAWYAHRYGLPSPGEAEHFRMQQGHEVGERARSLSPGGTLIPAARTKDGAELTMKAFADGTTTLYEATVTVPPLVAKADIVTRTAGGWHVLEVKSNFSDTKELSNLIDDLAYTVMVFTRAGLPVVKASLVLLSREYKFGADTTELFEVVDKTADALQRAKAFEALIDSYSNVVFGDAPPTPKLASACRACAWFADNCLGHGVAHSVLELPSLHHTKLKRLSAAGIVDISQVPNDLGLNDKQERARRSAVSEELVVDGPLAEALRAIRWPCQYLDFETVATVLPLYPDRRCHEQVLTQFSIHHRDSADGELRHSEYLADPARDCQRDLAEALIAALDGEGSVLVYTIFEQKRIEALAKQFDDLAKPLQSIVTRLVDLARLVSDHVYHPQFSGSFSIKAVLPALIPELSYEGLGIRDGDMAITRFARMARGEIKGDDVASTRRQLLEYCALDTLAMVRLHEKLIELAS